MFSLRGVGFEAAVGRSRILSDLSFNLEPGEIVGLVGPSGAGKSSLLRLLNRLQERSSGRLEFQGQPIEQLPVIELRQQVTLVNQESRLLDMTVQEALQYPLQLRRLPPAEIEARLKTWIERLQIPAEWLERRELELSLGQRQRVAIARAALIQPTALLLDEPTSAQDVGQAERLLRELVELVRQQQGVLVMANHQLEWVEQFCDRILHLQQGHLVGDWLASEVNWADLRQAIVTAEQLEQEEWA
ncbi:MAG: ATP-binding cassette domain-containing protein [Cyanobacteria bacterium Co-bin8]|nr:ATP-binding cassette domain-containing protein [Cyanobacteria bacterium Co-bin8]